MDMLIKVGNKYRVGFAGGSTTAIITGIEEKDGVKGIRWDEDKYPGVKNMWDSAKDFKARIMIDCGDSIEI